MDGRIGKVKVRGQNIVDGQVEGSPGRRAVVTRLFIMRTLPPAGDC